MPKKHLTPDEKRNIFEPLRARVLEEVADAAHADSDLESALRRELSKELREANPLLDLPQDVTLPVFVYGFLKHGEIAHSIVQEHLTEHLEAEVYGKLKIRDALPLLVLCDREPCVRGQLLFPKTPNLYHAICGYEPATQYEWSTTSASCSRKDKEAEPMKANVLIGRSPSNGSTPLDNNSFQSGEDVVLSDAPGVVAEALRRSSGLNEIKEFFELQMGYLLLWSIVERVVSLRYGASLDPDEKLKRLASSDEWKEALRGIAEDVRSVSPQSLLEVLDVRDPEEPRYRLDPANPRRSILFFYQFRNNIVHRGKAAWTDAKRLRLAAEFLMLCLRSLWASYGIPWSAMSKWDCMLSKHSVKP